MLGSRPSPPGLSQELPVKLIAALVFDLPDRRRIALIHVHGKRDMPGGVPIPDALIAELEVYLAHRGLISAPVRHWPSITGRS